jgi:hypothetical protein
MNTATETHANSASAGPDLVDPPRGLSPRRLEEMFGLPLGSWQSRHLFALRASSDRFAELGIKNGDYLIIEPGGFEREGQVVLSRSSKGTSLRRIPRPMGPDNDPSLWLPLRERNGGAGRERTVGRLLGVARRTDSGRLRPLGRREHSRSTQPAGPRLAESRSEPEGQMLDSVAERARKLLAWQEWIDVHAGDLAENSTTVEGWRRLENGLHTLIECLEVAHSPRLIQALFREAGAALRAIHGEMSRHRMAGVSRLCA